MGLNRLNALTVCGLLASTALSSAASAQLAPPAPVRQSIDGNGVDLFSGKAVVKTPSLTIGQGEPQARVRERFSIIFSRKNETIYMLDYRGYYRRRN